MDDEKNKLYVCYDQSESGGHICAGDEDDDWPSREPSYITTHFDKVIRLLTKDTLNLGKYLPEGEYVYNVSEEAMAATRVFVPVITYSDGNTFGSSHGHVYLVGAYATIEEAEEALEGAKAGDGYQPWVGYFSSLEDDEIKILAVI